MGRGRWIHPVVFLALVTLASAFWLHRIYLDRPSGHVAYADTDLGTYHYPVAVFVHEALSRGELPLWNPYQLAGQPFLALPLTAVLYPPNLVLLTLLPAARALEVGAVLHLLLAGFFTWLFAARLGLGVAGGLTAAVGFMLSGRILSGIYAPYVHATEVWLPALLFATHGLVSEARLRWAAALALCLAFALLGGHVQAFVYAVEFTCAYGLFVLVCVAPRGRRLRAVALAGIASVGALGLVAPQLLPTLELMDRATRDLAGLSLADAGNHAVEPLRLLFGTVGRFWPPESRSPSPFRWILALPALTLPLIACGWMAVRQRAHWLFMLAGLAGTALFLFGPATPLFRLYYALPLGHLFRMPIRMDFVYVLCACLLVGIGVEGVFTRLRDTCGSPRSAHAAAGLLALLVVGGLYRRSSLEMTHPVLERPGAGFPQEHIGYLRDRVGRERVFIETSGLSHDFPVKIGMMNGFFAVPDYEPTMPADYALYFAPTDGSLWHGYIKLLPRRRERQKPLSEWVVDPERAALVKLLDAMSVRFYLAPGRRGTLALERLVGGALIRGEGSAALLRREQAVPRAYTVGRVIVEPDPARARARILDPTFDPRHDAVVEVDLPALRVGDGPAGRADILTYTASRVRVEAACPEHCLLVLTDLYYPGWEAAVDGEAAELHRADAIFRGVELEPGRHEVEFQYRPRSFRIGAALCISTLLSAAGGAAWNRLRRGRGKPGAGEAP